MTKTRVLVVEDSITVRKYLVDCLRADPDLDVVAEAADGKQAIELCERLRPDVVTLDMVLPVMTGLSATEHIMAYCPTPILIVSASTNRGELFQTYDALAAGALDVMEKPVGGAGEPAWERAFTATVKLLARVKVITHVRARLGRPAAPAPGGPRPGPAHEYVAVGASTGGPQALATLLRALPADFPLPLLVVMHISPAFGAAFADWLHEQSPVPVRTPGPDQPLPRAGTPGVLLAPPDRHMAVCGGRLVLTRDREVHSCRPSVDVLFESVARELGPRAAGVLLTGMGRDGARGLLAIRAAGGATLAQDEATSVVYGMPREAVQLGAAGRVLPLGEIGPALVALAGRAAAGGGR
ncbi:MAG TPA: chemotaxis-specific protein-glutamate methyltransferase CheB [Urbifossiella sp.]|nr:chemotaxis-specific protein-glutamate methyltransferase CheB [Urbifossiella sp.]